jgi:hypothetical protein
MVLKSYFDGGNKEIPGEYDRLTLSVVSGTSEQWESFDVSWKNILDKHKASYLHTTDAVSLQNKFSTENGWSKETVDSLIMDCVGVIEKHIYIENVRQGLCPVTITIPLDDYARAKQANDKLPNTAADICATESLSFVFKWGKYIGAESYELYFDQGEPFYGHILDRKQNKKSIKCITLMEKITQLCKCNAQQVYAMQIADLFAWCINHNDNATRNWHRKLNDLKSWWSPILDYEHLLYPMEGVLDLVKSWKLPERRRIYTML